MHFLFYLVEVNELTDLNELEKRVKNFSLIQNVTSVIILALSPKDFITQAPSSHMIFIRDNELTEEQFLRDFSPLLIRLLVEKLESTEEIDEEILQSTPQMFEDMNKKYPQSNLKQGKLLKLRGDVAMMLQCN